MSADLVLLRRGMLYALLALLGAISLAWNLVACVLYPLLPRRLGTAIGRAVISRVYRRFWDGAQRLGMMRIDNFDQVIVDVRAGMK